MRLRRSCLAVPGSSEKMLAKAATLPADQVFLDLEDAVSPLEKEGARATVVGALNTHDYSGKTRVVRVNGVTTQWCLGDIVEVVGGAGAKLDCLMIPKVEDAAQLHSRRSTASTTGSASRPRSRTPAARSTCARSPRPPTASRRSSSGRATTRPRSGSRSS